MSCFWRGILSSLPKQKFQTIGIQMQGGIQNLVKSLKDNLQATPNVLWNNQKISNIQIKENIEHIKSYQLNTINQGYWCSTSDPFLFLISELFKINIQHTYINTKITYKHPKATETLHFKSNRGHFWFEKKTNNNPAITR